MRIMSEIKFMFLWVIFEAAVLFFCILLAAAMIMVSGVASGCIHEWVSGENKLSGEDDLGGGLVVAISMAGAFLISIIVSLWVHFFAYKKYWRLIK